MSHSNPRNYDNFVVAFYDVLNQGNTMKKWNDRDRLNSNEADANDAYDKTVNVILDMRTSFGQILKSFLEHKSQLPQMMSTDEQVEALDKNLKEPIRRQAFSDTNIWFIRASDNAGHVCASRILGVFTGVALIHLLNLAKHDPATGIMGVPARGAIGFGCGTDSLTEEDAATEIYGPVLETVHRIESKVAQYPRVVIHDGLFDFLNSELTKWDSKLKSEDNNFHRAMAHYLKRLLSLITIDHDGEYILDYAGSAISDQLKGALKVGNHVPKDVFQNAMSFAREEKARFISEGNIKLTGRYTMLVDYLESRKQYWQ